MTKGECFHFFSSCCDNNNLKESNLRKRGCLYSPCKVQSIVVGSKHGRGLQQAGHTASSVGRHGAECRLLPSSSSPVQDPRQEKGAIVLGGHSESTLVNTVKIPLPPTHTYPFPAESRFCQVVRNTGLPRRVAYREPDRRTVHIQAVLCEDSMLLKM